MPRFRWRGTYDRGPALSGPPLANTTRLEDVMVAAAIKRARSDHAIGVGALRTEQGPRRSVLHVYDHDLDDDTNLEP